MVFAFLATLIVSLVVALLAALQLGDFFRAGDELLVLLVVVTSFAALAIVVFAIGYRLAPRLRTLNAIAATLAVVATALATLPVERIAARAGVPSTTGLERSIIALELLVPALVTILVQWGLVRRRWLRLRGEDDLSLWPWVATVIGGLAILNPVGLDVIGQAITYSSTSWLRGLVRTVALSAAAALLAMLLIETYIRGRILRRRLAQPAA
jgi:hypothetical protein